MKQSIPNRLFIFICIAFSFTALQAQNVTLIYDNPIGNCNGESDSDTHPSNNTITGLSAIIPFTAFNITAEAWGGGGGGGGAKTTGLATRCAGGGGGAGGYIKNTWTNVSDVTMSIQVGGSGKRGESSNPSNGGAGSASFVSFNGLTITANGGAGGSSATTGSLFATKAGNGGIGGTTSGNGNNKNTTGASGDSGNTATSGYGGRGGKNEFGGNGGNGGNQKDDGSSAKKGIAQKGKDGCDAGGGGGGGWTQATAQNAPGGHGGGGRVAISYNIATPTISGNNNVYCEGGAITFTASHNASAGVSLQWYKDNTPIDGATNQTLTISNYSLSDAGSYTVVASYDITYQGASVAANGLSVSGNRLYGSLTSNAITVYPKPAVADIEETICSGESVNLIPNADFLYSYNGTVNAPSINLSNISATTNIDVTPYNPVTGCVGEAFKVNIKVNTPTSATINAKIIEGDGYVVAGNTYYNSDIITIENAAGCDSTIYLNISYFDAAYTLEGDGDFSDPIWQVSYENGVSKTNVPVPENYNSVKRITIKGNATLSSGTYKTADLEIDDFGSLGVSGMLEVTNELLLHSAENSASHLAQLAGGNMDIQNLTVKKSFQAATWYTIAFPFDVTLSNAMGESQQIDQKTIFCSTYNTSIRGTHTENTGKDAWQDIPKNTDTLNKHVGYLFACIDAEELYFHAVGDNISEAFDITKNITIRVNHTPNAEDKHKGWNIVANPYTSGFNLDNFVEENIAACGIEDMATYVYYTGSEGYNVQYGVLEPFKAFFVQAFDVDHGNESEEDHEADFVFRSDCTTFSNSYQLRTSTQPTYEQIKLGITRDAVPTFTDYYYLRLKENSNVSDGYDLSTDAVKLLTTKLPQIYRSTPFIDYAIDAMPRTHAVEKTLPLSYLAPAAGDYTINYAASAGAENIAQLYLIDHNTETTINLLETPRYTFNAAKAEHNHTRFELRFELLEKEEPPVIVEKPENPPVILPEINTPYNFNTDVEKIQIIAIDRQVIVNGLLEPSRVTVFDLTGRMIASFIDVANNQSLTIPYQGSILIVKVENEKQLATQKIIIK